MSFLKEFKEFAMRGNVVDLAVGVVIGTSFGKIVSAMVDKIFMPILGVATGGVDFSDQGITLRAAYGDVPAVVLGYGAFIQTIIDFTIVAFCIFMVVKGMNKLMPKPKPAPAAPKGPSAEELLADIRDLLKKQSKK